MKNFYRWLTVAPHGEDSWFLRCPKPQLLISGFSINQCLIHWATNFLSFGWPFYELIIFSTVWNNGIISKQYLYLPTRMILTVFLLQSAFVLENSFYKHFILLKKHKTSLSLLLFLHEFTLSSWTHKFCYLNTIFQD